jgi:hypothetical protein
LTNIAGTTAIFSVGADGAQPLDFQWRYTGNGLTYPLASGTKLRSGSALRPWRRVTGFAFSRDGNAIYCGAQNNDILVWTAPALDQARGRPAYQNTR